MTPEEVQSTARDRIGRLLGGTWRLEELLGTGGSAAVYRAAAPNSEPVAIKILHPHLALSQRAQKRLRREVVAAARIEHPGVVRIQQVGVDESEGVYLVMDLLHGQSVEQLRTASGGVVELRLALSIGIRLLEVLSIAHERGVVHRDIKPDNLFVTADSELKVLDFGVAGGRALATQSNTTATATLLGTPGFMAPEQARADWAQVGPGADLWSVGATLFTMLTGRHVHEGRTANEELGMAMTVPARPMRSLAPEITEELARVIDRALRYRPADRWRSASEMRTALAAASSKLSGPPSEFFCPRARADALGASTLSLHEGSQASSDATRRAGHASSRAKRRLLLALVAACALATAAAHSRSAGSLQPVSRLPLPRWVASAASPKSSVEPARSHGFPDAAGSSPSKATRQPSRPRPLPARPAGSTAQAQSETAPKRLDPFDIWGGPGPMAPRVDPLDRRQ